MGKTYHFASPLSIVFRDNGPPLRVRASSTSTSIQSRHGMAWSRLTVRRTTPPSQDPVLVLDGAAAAQHQEARVPFAAAAARDDRDARLHALKRPEGGCAHRQADVAGIDAVRVGRRLVG